MNGNAHRVLCCIPITVDVLSPNSCCFGGGVYGIGRGSVYTQHTNNMKNFCIPKRFLVRGTTSDSLMKLSLLRSLHFYNNRKIIWPSNISYRAFCDVCIHSTEARRASLLALCSCSGEVCLLAWQLLSDRKYDYIFVFPARIPNPHSWSLAIFVTHSSHMARSLEIYIKDD